MIKVALEPTTHKHNILNILFLLFYLLPTIWASWHTDFNVAFDLRAERRMGHNFIWYLVLVCLCFSRETFSYENILTNPTNRELKTMEDSSTWAGWVSLSLRVCVCGAGLVFRSFNLLLIFSENVLLAANIIVSASHFAPVVLRSNVAARGNIYCLVLTVHSPWMIHIKRRNIHKIISKDFDATWTTLARIFYWMVECFFLLFLRVFFFSFSRSFHEADGMYYVDHRFCCEKSVPFLRSRTKCKKPILSISIYIELWRRVYIQSNVIHMLFMYKLKSVKRTSSHCE